MPLVQVALQQREKIRRYDVQIIAMAENPISKAAKDVQQKAKVAHWHLQPHVWDLGFAINAHCCLFHRTLETR